MAVLKNVILNYVVIKTPNLEYKKEADPNNPVMNKVYELQAVVPKALLKKFKTKFKQVKSVSNAKVFTSEEYEQVFKVAAPDPEVYANGDGEYTVIRFNKKAYYKDGSPTKQPTVVGVKGTKTANGYEINTNVAIGNGSSGNIQFKERTWSNSFGEGVVLDLEALQVVELVPYVPAPEHEFEVEDDEFSDDDGFGNDEWLEVSDSDKPVENEDEDDDWG